MNHHAVEKHSVTAQYTKTAEMPYFKRFLGIEKVHRNSIKITVDLWKRYRVLTEFPGKKGGPPALQGGQPGPRGGTCHRGVQSERLLICLFLQRTDTVGERIDFPHEHTEYLCIHFCIH